MQTTPVRSQHVCNVTQTHRALHQVLLEPVMRAMRVTQTSRLVVEVVLRVGQEISSRQPEIRHVFPAMIMQPRHVVWTVVVLVPTRRRVLAIRDTTALQSLTVVAAQHVLRAPLGGTSLRKVMEWKLRCAQSQALASAPRRMARAAVLLQVRPPRSHAARVSTMQTIPIRSQHVCNVPETHRALHQVLLVPVMRAMGVTQILRLIVAIAVQRVLTTHSNRQRQIRHV